MPDFEPSDRRDMDAIKKGLDRTKRSLEDILRKNILPIAIVLAGFVAVDHLRWFVGSQ